MVDKTTNLDEIRERVEQRPWVNMPEDRRLLLAENERLRAEIDHLEDLIDRGVLGEIRRLEAENRQLRETIAEWQQIHGVFTGDVHRACQAEIERLRAAVETAAAMVRSADPDLSDALLRTLR